MSSPRTYAEFIDRVIEFATVGVQRDYKADTPKHIGSMEGLQTCRGLLPYELGRALRQAHAQAKACRDANAGKFSPGKFWRLRCRESEIEWICNCVSVLLDMASRPTIVHPTRNALLNVSNIIGSHGAIALGWPELHASGSVLTA